MALTTRHRQRPDPLHHVTEQPPIQMPLRQQQPVVAGMLDQPPTGLHQPLLQARQRPTLDPVRHSEPSPQVAQVVGQYAELQPHFVGPKAMARKPRPVCGLLPFSDPLAFSNPRMILKWVGTGEDTGWVVISFLAGSGRGISRGREAQPGRSRIASCATSFLSVRFALRAESGRREPGGRTQARLGGASRPRRGRVSPARAARGQQFPLALLHP